MWEGGSDVGKWKVVEGDAMGRMVFLDGVDGHCNEVGSSAMCCGV